MVGRYCHLWFFHQLLLGDRLGLHQALRLKGVPSQFLAYPREPHGLLERQHQLDYMNRIREAFDTYVKPSAPVRWQP